MSVDLLTLPDEFEGLPERVRERAFDRAEAQLPANIVAVLGQARAEQVLVDATAHVLTMSGEGTENGTRPSVPGKPWAGSSYGHEVERALALMGKPSGRTRSLPISSGET